MKTVLTSRSILLSGVFLAAVAVLLTVSLSQPALGIRTGTTAFSFNPPDGLTWNETSKITYSHSIDGKDTINNQFIATIQYTIHKDETGYVVIRRPISFKSLKKGSGQQELEAICEEVIQNWALEIQVSLGGEAQAVQGHSELIMENIVEACQKRLPGDMIFLNPNAFHMLVEKRLLEWDALYARYSGLKVKKGEVWKGTYAASYISFIEAVPVPLSVKYVDDVKIDGKDCVKLQYKAVPDSAMEIQMGSALAKYAVDMFEEDDSDHSSSDVKLSVKGTCVLDPSTMMYQKSNESTVVSWKDSATGQGVFKHQLKYDREVTFKYLPYTPKPKKKKDKSEDDDDESDDEDEKE